MTNGHLVLKLLLLELIQTMQSITTPVYYRDAWKSSLAEIVEVEIEVVSPSIVLSGVSPSLKRSVTYMVLKANDRRTSCPCHDEFRGPRSDYVRQVALATTTTTITLDWPQHTNLA
ncbi:hypothetical protein TNCV_1523431 [Trichonephila clavipes]|nr:hypothetical protein TNCV_1523431 [Trichonephila clavipes]